MYLIIEIQLTFLHVFDWWGMNSFGAAIELKPKVKSDASCCRQCGRRAFSLGWTKFVHSRVCRIHSSLIPLRLSRQNVQNCLNIWNIQTRCLLPHLLFLLYSESTWNSIYKKTIRLNLNRIIYFDVIKFVLFSRVLKK